MKFIQILVQKSGSWIQVLAIIGLVQPSFFESKALAVVGERIAFFEAYSHPRNLRLKESCLVWEDAVIATALERQIFECQFDAWEKTPPAPERLLQCADTLTLSFTRIKAYPCRNYFASSIRTTLRENLKRQFLSLPFDAGLRTFHQGSLRQGFRHFNHWLAYTENTLYSDREGYQSFRDPISVFQNDRNRVWVALWKRIRDVSQTSENILDPIQNFTQGLWISTQVLNAAYAEKVSPVVFFPLLEQAAEQLNRRLELIGEFAQISCELLACTQGNNTEMGAIHRLILQLDEAHPDIAQIQQDLSKVKKGELREFISIFIHSSLSYRARLSKLVPQVSRFSQMPLSVVPEYATGFFTILKSRIQAARAFLQSQGVLLEQSSEAPWLTMGLDRKTVEETPGKVDELKNYLVEATHQFEKTRDSFAQQATQENSAQIQKSQMIRQFQDTREELAQMASDLIGLQSKLMSSDNVIHLGMQKFYRLLSSEAWANKHGKQLSKDADDRIFVRGSSAKFRPSGVGQNIRTVAVKDRPISLKAGQSILFSVTGSWSPTCALERERFPANAKTGPEGFMIHETRGRSQVSSVSQDASVRDFTSSQQITGNDWREFQNQSRSESDQTLHSDQHSSSNTNTTFWIEGVY